MNAPQSASEIVAGRVQELRKRRGMTAKDLAERCRQMGAPSVTASVIANIESGRPDEHGRRRRNVTLEEWLILAQALHVAPIHLLVPVDSETELMQLTPEEPDVLQGSRNVPAGFVRAWVRGAYPLTHTDRRTYTAEVPEAEWQPHVERSAVDSVVLDALREAGFDVKPSILLDVADEGEEPEHG